MTPRTLRLVVLLLLVLAVGAAWFFRVREEAPREGAPGTTAPATERTTAPAADDAAPTATATPVPVAEAPGMPAMSQLTAPEAHDDDWSAEADQEEVREALRKAPTPLSYFDRSGQSYRATDAKTREDDAALFARMAAAAERGDLDAQFNLGLLYDQGRGVAEDAGEAVRWYTRAAEEGHVRAQRNLAYLYDAGRGTVQDDLEAAKWYRRAAEQGDPGGQNNLATMHILGRGVERDFAEAAKWFRMAADQGDSGAQFNLGRLYIEGKGVAADAAAAYHWCALAAQSLPAETSRNLAVGCRNLASTHLTAEQLTAAKNAVRDWKPSGPSGPD